VRVTPRELQVLSVPRWSPDGERLAFVAFAEGQADVYITRGDETPPLRVTSDSAREVAPSWSPDGTSLVFGVERAGGWGLTRLKIATGATTTEGPPGALAAQEAPDGTLFFLRADRRGLWRLPPGGGGAEVVSSELGPQNRADWIIRPQGIYYLVYSPREDTHLLRFVPARGGEPRTLGRVREAARPGIAVSADGRSVFLSRTDSSACDLMVAENLL
jgi:TolB protein